MWASKKYPLLPYFIFHKNIPGMDGGLSGATHEISIFVLTVCHQTNYTVSKFLISTCTNELNILYSQLIPKYII